MVSERELKRSGLLGSKNVSTYVVLTNDCVLLCDNRKINKFNSFGQSRHLKLCQKQIVSDLVIVQEKEEHLLKITINMAITFPTHTLGHRHKCRGI